MKSKEEIDKLADEYTDAWFQESEEESASRGYIDGYTQCQEDMADNFLSLIEEYREKELPNKDVPYHYEAEISSGLNLLIEFIKNKQD